MHKKQLLSIIRSSWVGGPPAHQQGWVGHPAGAIAAKELLLMHISSLIVTYKEVLRQWQAARKHNSLQLGAPTSPAGELEDNPPSWSDYG